MTIKRKKPAKNHPWKRGFGTTEQRKEQDRKNERTIPFTCTMGVRK